MSQPARAALASAIGGQYPGSDGPGFAYSDPLGVGQLLTETSSLAHTYFACEFAYPQLLSGLHAMQSCLLSLAKRDSVVYSLGDGGGHYATQEMCRDLGLEPRSVPHDREAACIDYEALQRELRLTPADVLYLDLSTALRLPDVAKLREMVGDECLIMFDASHVLGLLPQAYNPQEFWAAVSLVTASTHKTLPGPQKGIVLSSNASVSERFASRLPFRVSSGHSGAIAALGQTLRELLPVRHQYAHAVIDAANLLAASLKARGIAVAGQSGVPIQTHQVWVDLPAGAQPAAWRNRAEAAGIRTTFLTLPSTGRMGIRMGTQEIVRWGVAGPAIEELADLIAQFIVAETFGPEVRERVKEFALRYPGIAFPQGE